MADAAKPSLLMALMGKPKLGDKQDPPRPFAKQYRGAQAVAPSEGSGDEDGDGDVSDEAPDPMLTSAAEDVMDSMQSGDAEEFAASLRAFVSMC